MQSEPTTIAPRLMGIDQVASYIGLSHHTVYKFVSQRKIPHVKLGKLVKFDRLEIDKWIASHSVKVRRSFSALTP